MRILHHMHLWKVTRNISPPASFLLVYFKILSDFLTCNDTETSLRNHFPGKVGLDPNPANLVWKVNARHICVNLKKCHTLPTMSNSKTILWSCVMEASTETFFLVSKPVEYFNDVHIKLHRFSSFSCLAIRPTWQNYVTTLSGSLPELFSALKQNSKGHVYTALARQLRESQRTPQFHASYHEKENKRLKLDAED